MAARLYPLPFILATYSNDWGGGENGFSAVLLFTSMIDKIIEAIRNPWVIFGFAAQFVFFLRFAVQWWVSEKKKESVIPVSFWYLSIVGTLMILVYSIKRQDIVFIAASCLNSLIYVRNLVLIHKKANNNSSQV